MTRRISIFGVTGSIGQSTVDLIKRDQDTYDVIALSGGRNIAQLAQDAIDLKAEIAVTAFEELLPDLRAALKGSGVVAAAGEVALLEAADRPTDWCMSAIVGLAGLAPGMRALRHGGVLALANKESLVSAGPMIMAEAAKYGATILPVDSEHSAIFQALTGEPRDAVERVIITASGGAFRDWPLDELKYATLAQASSHPNWDMGQRITIDSASMFNKAMEVIEAKEFFKFKPAQIEVLIHPQSLIHAMIGYNDGGLMAHVGPADMRHAIGFALHWPDRKHLPVERLDFARIGAFEFRAPCDTRYPALRLAREVMNTGGLSGAAFTAAKDAVLDAFIAGRCGFMDMAGMVEDVLTRITRTSDHNAPMTLENIRLTDHLAQKYAADTLTARAS
ncbi:1-deoxy-D-xylulose-5-phosphate reductoisomerase [Halocynthiibacter styelae]|uniref:1-deoxy-D-xylulose 5-phosphate reductoisomerase n=1 Tax=Halocynthiibacter styelae TaxID=2761955 RepID=A0A8J7IVI0_9RHOB|nr:1-deoxy-D-xylulose-5-phosphate reductoisomerase [Paenihalocynthiibacter styelae]MBI1492325.1 1-deoxy-D-xylulose-5-phosphate reductoisomerase [Paenihalocynthiibacter styelae]